MEDEVTLLAYLQPALPYIGIEGQSKISRKIKIHANVLTPASLDPWKDFTIDKIMQPTQNLTAVATILRHPMFPSPPLPITYKYGLVSRVMQHVVPRVQTSLKTSFVHLQEKHCTHMVAFTPVSLYTMKVPGTEVKRNGTPVMDLAFCQIGTTTPRAVGIVELSRKFNSDMRTGNATQQQTYKRYLAHLNYYMSTSGSRYGFILTNRELVVVRRCVGGITSLEVADPVEWYMGGTEDRPALTILLALWYIGMLAAKDDM
ncbi:hypothetical protein BJX99DRAFT_264922 [Aspergillus californicus]